MSNMTISSLTHLSRDQLADLLLSRSSATTSSNESGSPHPSIAVIDVRDSDHVGGHIKGSTWIPSHTLEARLPELLRTLREKEKVVFHCALSQQRGPSAALKYAREMNERKVSATAVGSGKGGDDESERGAEQEVCVLMGGFNMWQAKYGEDERLTEGYVKDIWDD